MNTIRPIPDDFLLVCDRPGRLEELTIPDFSSALVYLPWGYDESDRRYNVFYLLHGGGGSPYSFFSEDGLLKNMFDHMISRKVMRPMIVVAPTYYPPGCSDRGIAYSAEAVKDFGPILMSRIVARVDETFRTKEDRMGRAIGGFSMGAVATWYVLMAGTHLFHWFMPMSGDCWICGERGGGLHPRQTAALLCDTLLGQDFYLHALIGDQDIAYPNLNPQMEAMREFSHVFAFDKNTHYSVLKGGVHDYPDIRRYIFNALPEFF